MIVGLGCPATLTQVMFPAWPLAPLPSLCVILHFVPTLTTFSSTFSVCLIALQRYLIKHRYRDNTLSTVKAQNDRLNRQLLH